MSSSPDGPTLRAPLGGAALHLDLGAEHDAVGWTVLGGGRRTVRRVDWWLATSDDLLPGVDAREWVRERVTAAGGGGGATAAFLTSRRLDAHVVESAECEHGTVRAVATVGLGNALTAGDDATPHRVGTINVAVVLPCPCTEEAMLETLGLASEAKCIAVLDAGMRSVVSARRATGTGTDALVVLAPAPSPEGPEERQPYAGKHTTLGAAVGRAVEGAVRRGARDWLREADVPFPPDPAGRRGRGRVVLIGGGVRSGKSAFAESLVLAMSCRHPAPPTYLATAQAWDDEMRDRIARHQADRGERFSTLEVPMDLPEELRAISGRERGDTSAVLVDCLTLWVSNLLCADLGDAAIDARVDALCEALEAASVPVVLVTNEVGLGIVPEHRLGRRFRDLAGRLHQRLSGLASEVYFAALGNVLRLHPGPVEALGPARPGGGREVRGAAEAE